MRAPNPFAVAAPLSVSEFRELQARAPELAENLLANRQRYLEERDALDLARHAHDVRLAAYQTVLDAARAALGRLR
jgi:hypothetical protein